MNAPASSPRLVREVRSLFGALRWFMIICLVLTPLMLLIQPRPGRPVFTNTGDLRFSTDAIQLTQADGRPAGVKLGELRGKLAVTDTRAAPEFVAFARWSTVLQLLIVCAVMGGVFHLLWRVCQNIERGEIFTDATLLLVRRLGTLMVIGAFIASVLFTWVNYRIGVLVERTFKFGGLTGHFGEFPQYLTFDFILCINGLIILSLAEVFRRGLALQRESELTV